jgi:hypothetical protein
MLPPFEFFNDFIEHRHGHSFFSSVWDRRPDARGIAWRRRQPAHLREEECYAIPAPRSAIERPFRRAGMTQSSARLCRLLKSNPSRANDARLGLVCHATSITLRQARASRVPFIARKLPTPPCAEMPLSAEAPSVTAKKQMPVSAH